jgi:NTP pyrophosphatase (non-canonical NTP hydrolase)
MDSDATIGELKRRVVEFRDARRWRKFHAPKELALSLSIEAAELLEHFRYKSDAEVRKYLKKPGNKRAVSHELSDILFHVFLLANDMGIDLSSAHEEKMRENARKYPLHLCKGRNKKYTEYAKDRRK